VWKGGLASHGGVFAIILALVVYSHRVTHKSVWWLFDRMIPAVAAVCFCIRFGNLMNSEIFGYPTSLPWGFEFVRSREWHALYEGQPCHPTQIYEMLYCLVAGVTAWVMYHRFGLQRRVGLITGVSLLIFFGTRFALEFMKNPQVADEVGMALNIGQLLSVPLILLGVWLIATSGRRKEDLGK
jgi:prolipoprotein diacylglyceryl transferase